MKNINSIIFSTILLISCADQKDQSKTAVAENVSSEYYTVEFPATEGLLTASGSIIQMNKNYKTALETAELINFNSIKTGDANEYSKLLEFNPNQPDFLKAYYGECWDSRPKDFSELEFPKLTRSSFLQIKETDFDILGFLDLIGFNFSNKDRLFFSKFNYSGKHICNEKVYDYYIRIVVGYIVKVKRGGIKISNLDQLTAEINAKRATAQYKFVSEGIKINPESSENPDFTSLSGGLFNDSIKIVLDKKIDYILNEISKKNGAFIGQPIPADFDIVIKQSFANNGYK